MTGSACGAGAIWPTVEMSPMSTAAK